VTNLVVQGELQTLIFIRATDTDLLGIGSGLIAFFWVSDGFRKPQVRVNKP
jgi:hypothetical protein